MGNAWHQLFPIFIIFSIYIYIYQSSHKIHYSYIRYIYIYIYHVTNHYSYWEDSSATLPVWIIRRRDLFG